MRRTRVKFCGFTRAEDAEQAVALGVDAIGFVCVPGSRRYLEPSRAATLRQSLPPFVSVVALVSNAEAAFVREVIAALRPDLLQYHGQESAAFCEAIGWPYLKALGMADPASALASREEHRAARGFLLDSHGADGLGGTGQGFDWAQVPSDFDRPWMLAGGLRPETVAGAVTMLRPYAVDVSSGIEAVPGVKDAQKMRAFLDAVRRADSSP
ncbi:MAG TPA: phosphoribosylanthranilate isomerase [Nevskiaceae bacterium]|nr:phosphoribosylanthranilate isomerase [Nevskiaceae bacterium]